MISAGSILVDAYTGDTNNLIGSKPTSCAVAAGVMCILNALVYGGDTYFAYMNFSQ